MRIAVKMTLMVLCSLVGGLVLSGISWFKYSELEVIRKEHTELQLALRDAQQLEVSLNQWLSDVDLFFSQRQQHLTSDIGRRNLHLRAQLQRLESLAPAGAPAIKAHLGTIQQIIKDTATQDPGNLTLWNQRLNKTDQQVARIEELLDQLHSQFEVSQKQSHSQLSLAQQNLLPTLASYAMGYILIMALLWLWMSQTLVRPLQRLQQQALKPLGDQSPAPFSLYNGPFELQKLAGSLSHTSHRLADAQKRADSLQQQHDNAVAQLESLMSASDDAIVTLDANGNVLSLNRATRDKFNLATDAAGQTHISELVPKLGEAGSQLNAISQEEHIGQSTDGRKFALEISSGAFNQAAGCYTLIMRDITQQKLQQLKIQKLNEKLVATSKQTGTAEVTTGVLENIRQTLDTMNSTVAQLQGGDNSYSQPQVVLLQKQLSQIGDIIATQQQLAENNSKTESLDLAEALDEALGIHNSKLGNLNIEVIREYQSTPIQADRSGLIQILVNLICNAIEAIEEQNPHQPQLKVRVGQLSNQRLGIDIIDNGIGLTAEQKQKLFRHGYTTKPTGRGLGLNSSAVVAKKMQGDIQAVSEGQGQGSLFRLQLPAARAAKKVA